MLDVLLTIDVEVWCDGWQDVDRKFPSAFQRYVYGSDGRYGLPEQLRIMSDHGHRAVCFVEPLFAGRFGLEPLREIVGLIERSGHETQLHLHTEWVDEARQPLLDDNKGKRQHMRDYSLAEQTRLIAVGIEWLQAAGAPRPTAFRAGSFAFNADTLTALAANGIFIDSSYNASMFGPSSGVEVGGPLNVPCMIGPVLELPMTVYADGRGLRHTQLTACSWPEMERLLWKALEQDLGCFNILSHNFELLAPGLRRPDPVVIRRLERLCAFLDRHRGQFRVRGLRDAPPPARQPAAGTELQSPLWRTSARMVEQAWRRVYAR